MFIAYNWAEVSIFCIVNYMVTDNIEFSPITKLDFSVLICNFSALNKEWIYKVKTAFIKVPNKKFIFELAYLAIGLIFTLILSIVIVVILENIKKFIVRLFKLLKMKLLVENK